jgi:hypothetical protein
MGAANNVWKEARISKLEKRRLAKQYLRNYREGDDKVKIKAQAKDEADTKPAQVEEIGRGT